MKKIIYIFAAIAAVSCSGDAGDTSYAPVAPFTLSVDRTEIASDGKQTATFIITDAEGKVLTDNQDLLANIWFKNEATGKRLTRRTKTFKSVEDGEYTFSATVSGEECKNKVTIVSSGRSNYEVFRKNVALYRFTATWCVNCPSMTEGLDRVNDWTKSRLVELGLHGKGSTYVLSDGQRYVADYLIGQFKAGGFPSCVYDLDLMSDTRVYTEIETIVFDRIADFPTSCGIHASSTYAEGKLAISASIKSSTGGKYDIGFAVLKDDCPGDASAYEEEYDNVVMAMSGNYEVMSSNAFELQKDAESAAASQEITVNIAEADREDYSVVVFALKQNGSDVDIDNIVKFPLGGSVDYAYN